MVVDAAENTLSQRIPSLQTFHFQKRFLGIELLKMCLSLFSRDLQIVQNLLFAALPLPVQKLLDDGQTFETHVHRWTAGQKALGVRMLWVVEDLLHSAAFQNLSIMHDGHIVGDFGHHTEVVGDENHAHACFGLQLAQ